MGNVLGLDLVSPKLTCQTDSHHFSLEKDIVLVINKTLTLSSILFLTLSNTELGNNIFA